MAKNKYSKDFDLSSITLDDIYKIEYKFMLDWKPHVEHFYAFPPKKRTHLDFKNNHKYSVYKKFIAEVKEELENKKIIEEMNRKYSDKTIILNKQIDT